ncbi:MAG TPA: hypothetical protein VF699_02325 [Caulobacteraceae bacterium]
MSRAAEQRSLTADEWAVVEKSHYPAVEALDEDELAAMRQRLRTLRSKARDRLHQQRREVRGKAEPRGARAVQETFGTALKLSSLTGALKRVNRSLERTRKQDQRALSRGALTMKRANARPARHPAAGRTSGEGMNSRPDIARAPSGALHEEGHRPVLERSRKTR